MSPEKELHIASRITNWEMQSHLVGKNWLFYKTEMISPEITIWHTSVTAGGTEGIPNLFMINFFSPYLHPWRVFVISVRGNGKVDGTVWQTVLHTSYPDILEELTAGHIEYVLWSLSRSHCHERPPVFKDQIFQPNFLADSGPVFHCDRTCHQGPPVLRDHIFMINGWCFKTGSTVVC